MSPGLELTNGKVDLKESLEFAQRRPPANVARAGEASRLLAQNLWPTDAHLPNFKRLWASYHRQMSTLASRVLEQLVEEGLLQPLPGGSQSLAEGPPLHWRSRILHYCVQGVSLGQELVAPHTDIALFNLLHIEQSGLEVQDGTGQWHPVAPRAGELIVLFGELISHFSRGAISPCPHRVLATGRETPRVSVPFFVYPALTSPVPAHFAPKGEPIGTVPTVQDILLQRIAESWPLCFPPT